jgi:hypothetical protein
MFDVKVGNSLDSMVTVMENIKLPRSTSGCTLSYALPDCSEAGGSPVRFTPGGSKVVDSPVTYSFNEEPHSLFNARFVSVVFHGMPSSGVKHMFIGTVEVLGEPLWVRSESVAVHQPVAKTCDAESYALNVEKQLGGATFTQQGASHHLKIEERLALEISRLRIGLSPKERDEVLKGLNLEPSAFDPTQLVTDSEASLQKSENEEDATPGSPLAQRKVQLTRELLQAAAEYRANISREERASTSDELRAKGCCPPSSSEPTVSLVDNIGASLLYAVPTGSGDAHSLLFRSKSGADVAKWSAPEGITNVRFAIGLPYPASIDGVSVNAVVPVTLTVPVTIEVAVGDLTFESSINVGKFELNSLDMNVTLENPTQSVKIVWISISCEQGQMLPSLSSLAVFGTPDRASYVTTLIDSLQLASQRTPPVQRALQEEISFARLRVNPMKESLSSDGKLLEIMISSGDVVHGFRIDMEQPQSSLSKDLPTIMRVFASSSDDFGSQHGSQHGSQLAEIAMSNSQQRDMLCIGEFVIPEVLDKTSMCFDLPSECKETMIKFICESGNVALDSGRLRLFRWVQKSSP